MLDNLMEYELLSWYWIMWLRAGIWMQKEGILLYGKMIYEKKSEEKKVSILNKQIKRYKWHYWRGLNK